MFFPNMLVHYMYSTIIACIVGPSPHGNEFQRINYMWSVVAVDHDKAPGL